MTALAPRPAEPAARRGRRVPARPARRRPDPVPGRRRHARGHVVAGPDVPRGEPQTPQRPAPARDRRRSSASSTTLERGGIARRDVGRTRSGPRPRADPGLGRARPGRGRGITITISGPIAASAVEDLVNELQNAGRRGDRDRGRPGRAGDGRSAASPGALSVDDTPLGDPFTIRAIGTPGDADRVAGPGRRDHRPARRDGPGRHARRRADRPDGAAGDDARPRARPWPAARSDTLGRMTDATRPRAAPRRRGPAPADPSVRRRASGWSTGSAPTSGCAAGAAAATSSSSGEPSSGAWPASSAAATPALSAAVRPAAARQRPPTSRPTSRHGEDAR